MTQEFSALTVAQVAAFPRPGTVVPGRVEFVPGGAGAGAISYLFSEEGSLVRSLWRYDVATGERRIIAGPQTGATAASELTRDEELRRERARLRELGVTDYQWAQKAPQPVLLVPSGGRISVAIGDGPLRELDAVQGALDPRLSPDGRMVAFVRDGDIHVINADGTNPRRLTFDALPGLTNGLAEFIAQEELDRDRGFWWDPAGEHIAFVQADERHIPVYPIVHQGKGNVDVEEHRYPFAGQANARLRMGVIQLATGAITWLDLAAGDDFYIARAGWTNAGGQLVVSVLNREQTALRILSFDSTGAGRLLLEEETQPWFNLDSGPRFLDSGEFVRTSEATGYRHITLHSPDGRLIRRLTEGSWVVTGVNAIDEARRLVYFTATKESVRERHLYRVPLAGGAPERLTTDPGWHGCVVAPGGEWCIDVHSSRHAAPRYLLRNLHSGQAVPFHDNGGISAASLGLTVPEFFETRAADGTPLQGALFHPPSTLPRPLPAVVAVYGGPHAQRVADDWSITMDLRSQYLAQHGYLVVRLDNRGSANRGLAFEAHLNRNMGAVEVEDQAAAVRSLAAAGLIDLDRIGVTGWSYGGYLTLMCMVRKPELFRVGVAGAPVTHWDGYDTGYTERYMGTPQSNPDGYRVSAVMNHVEALTGKLMLVHGMVDENVHFRHTARLAVALAAAGKDYELLAFPEERHMPRDAKGLEYQEQRVIDFFTANL